MSRGMVEYLICSDSYYAFNDELQVHLIEALQFLDDETAKRILDECLFLLYETGEGSWHLSRAVVRGRSIIVLDVADLQDGMEATITVLHEAAHVFLNHSHDGQGKTRECYRRQEDEAWDLVKRWLPSEFQSSIAKAELEGGGNRSRYALSE